MAVIKRISPVSAFKIGAVVYAVIGLVALILMLPLAMLLGSYVTPHADGPTNGFSLMLFRPGIITFVIMPIVYAIFGGVFSMIAAAVFNLAAGWMGGLEVEIN